MGIIPRTIEVRRDAGYWSVYVNGHRAVDRESYEVAQRIAYDLTHPGVYEHSESYEVADSIRRWLAEADDADRGAGAPGP